MYVNNNFNTIFYEQFLNELAYEIIINIYLQKCRSLMCIFKFYVQKY